MLYVFSIYNFAKYIGSSIFIEIGIDVGLIISEDLGLGNDKQFLISNLRTINFMAPLARRERYLF